MTSYTIRADKITGVVISIKQINKNEHFEKIVFLTLYNFSFPVTMGTYINTGHSFKREDKSVVVVRDRANYSRMTSNRSV